MWHIESRPHKKWCPPKHSVVLISTDGYLAGEKKREGLFTLYTDSVDRGPSGPRKTLRFISNAGWLTIGNIAGDLSGLLYFVILSRYFGLTGIGQYSYAFTIASFMSGLVDFGCSEYGIRECARISLEARRRLMGQLLAIQLSILIVGSIILFGLFLYTSTPYEKIVVILLLTCYQCAMVFAATLFVPSFAQQSMVYPAIARMVSRISGTLTSICLVIWIHTSLALTLIPFPITASILVVAAVISAVYYVGKFSLSFDLSHIRILLHTLLPFAASPFFAEMNFRVGMVMLSQFQGDEIAGMYATSLKFLVLGLWPLEFLALAAYPCLSARYLQKGDHFTQTMSRLLRISLVTGGLLAWMLIFVAPQMLVPLFGAQFVQVIPCMKAMSIIALCYTLDIVSHRLLAAMGLQSKRVKVQFAGIILNLLLSFVFTPIYGIIGAMFSLIISVSVINIACYRILWNIEAIKIEIVGILNSFFTCLLVSVSVGAFTRWFSGYHWLSAVLSMLTFVVMSYTSRNHTNYIPHRVL
jgi:O-antigen/teichoic acid export membrane protein